jgi:hypothetical protein
VSELNYRVTGVRVEPYAAVPTLLFHLCVDSPEPVASVALRCQIRIEPRRRAYDEREEQGLQGLFGQPSQWARTLEPFLWTHVSITLPGFRDSMEVDLPVACTYDFDVTAASYLHALGDGEVPLLFLFSGTIFTRSERGLQATQIAWDRDVRSKLPVATWREMMNLYFPNSGWLRLHRDTLDSLLAYKAAHALSSWDDVMAGLIGKSGKEAA